MEARSTGENEEPEEPMGYVGAGLAQQIMEDDQLSSESSSSFESEEFYSTESEEPMEVNEYYGPEDEPMEHEANEEHEETQIRQLTFAEVLAARADEWGPPQPRVEPLYLPGPQLRSYPPAPYKCNDCNFVAYTSTTLKTHRALFVRNVLPYWKCPHCCFTAGVQNVVICHLKRSACRDPFGIPLIQRIDRPTGQRNQRRRRRDE